MEEGDGEIKFWKIKENYDTLDTLLDSRGLKSAQKILTKTQSFLLTDDWHHTVACVVFHANLFFPLRFKFKSLLTNESA